MDKISSDLLAFFQKNTLWQFFSRTWDRQENIDGVLNKAEEMLTGQPVSRETPMDKLLYADALIMVKDFKERFPWLNDTTAADIRQLMADLKARLVETAITKSTNRELNHHLY